MGLDVIAYEKLTPKEPGDCELDDDIQLYVNTDFTERSDGLRSWTYSPSGEILEFRAGSYSGYNEWRENLSKIILGIPAERVWVGTSEGEMKGPFCELINFSDCEGIFGPKTSLKLYEDFKDNELKFALKADTDDIRTYTQFMHAFQIASKGGAVQFC